MSGSGSVKKSICEFRILFLGFRILVTSKSITRIFLIDHLNSYSRCSHSTGHQPVYLLIISIKLLNLVFVFNLRINTSQTCMLIFSLYILHMD